RDGGGAGGRESGLTSRGTLTEFAPKKWIVGLAVMSTTEGSAEDLPTLVDTALLRDPPTTTRGTRTRAALVAAARVVFERDGFIDSRLSDLSKEAKGTTVH